MGAIASTPLQGQGTQEQAWLRCDWLWQQPSTSARSLCADHDRLVVVAPHPDDEILGCGGLLHHAAAQGMEVGVIAVTDGEACYPGEPWWTPERLRSARRAELAAALAELGIAADATFHLGIGDGAVSKHEQGLQDWLQQHLQPGDLVLAPWRFDGHPDHEAAGRAACRAGRAVGCRRLEYPVWGWHWLDPACAHMAWEFPQLVDISAVASVKRSAIARFRTQTGNVPGLNSPPVLPSHVLARFFRDYEVFLA